MVRLTEYKCMCCGICIDETEYTSPEDADICGYCFVDKVNEIKNRNLTFASGLNDCGKHREIVVMADVEIRLEKAQVTNDTKAIEIYERLLRLMRA